MQLTAAAGPGLSSRDKRLTLAAATLGSFVALLDSTVVSIALPAISGDLGGGLESQQWIVNAYLLMLGSLILIGGSLGDVFGERRLFVLGAAGFGVVSAIAGGTLDLDGFRMALVAAASLLALGGAVGVLGIRNQRRDVPASSCAGGQLVGARSAVADAPGVARVRSRISRAEHA
jgi:MFS family permease